MIVIKLIHSFFVFKLEILILTKLFLLNVTLKGCSTNIFELTKFKLAIDLTKRF